MKATKMKPSAKLRIIGPASDPVRQQGRDPGYKERECDWFDAEQGCDRARSGRQRQYHVSYRTSSGATFDEWCDHWSRRAREFEEAGINLGWGGCARKSSTYGTYEAELDRRYTITNSNAWRKRLKSRS